MSNRNLAKTWSAVEIEDCLLPYPNGKKIRQGWSPQCEGHPAHAHDEWAVLRTSAIQDGKFLDIENKKLPESLEPRTQLEVKSGDILITCAGPRSRCGVACLVRTTRPRLLISGKMYQLRANPKVIDRQFLELFLRESSTQKKIDEMKTGISDSGLNLTHDRFRTLSIPLPPLDEQKHIVAKIEELFSELDAGEENLRKARAQLGVYRQSLLKQAFEGKLTEKWRAVHTDMLNQEPSPWQQVKLGSLIAPPTYGTSKKCSYESSGRGVLRIPNVVNGTIDSSDLKFSEFTDEECKLYELHEDDILIIRSNGSVSIVGRCARVASIHKNFIYAGYLIRLRCIKNLLNSKFLCHQLSSLKLRVQIESSAKSTSGVNNINSKEIQQLVVALPSVLEQQEIVRILEEQFTSIEQNEREIDQALKRSEALRQSILKKAFSGGLVDL